jgi:CheY-like chemotaxis protein
MSADASSEAVVMVVEDYEDTRQMTRRMLEMCGCRVIEAADGQQAIELSQRERLDLVLMDLNMPVLDGFTAALRIREYEPTRDVPVVAVTAYDSAEARAAACAVGCGEYVVKPLSLEELTALLDRVLPLRGH